MRGHVYKRGKTWSVDARLYKDAAGAWVRVQKGGFKTKSEAEDYVRESISSAKRGEFGEYNDMLCADFLLLWLEQHCRFQLKITTFLNRKRMIEKRIIPALGRFKLEELRPIHFTQFYNGMRADGLSGDYIHTMHAIMRTAFRHAQKWQITSRNIFQNVDAPKKSKKANLKTWTVSEATAFLKYTGSLERAYVPVPHPLPDYRHIAYVLAIFTGMRRGEILGLRWCDIDFDRLLLRVVQTVYKPEGLAPYISTPKTERSARSISITDEVAAALKTHKAAQNKIRLALGPDYHDHDLVCPRPAGEPMDPRGLLEHFILCIKRSGLPRIRFHDLRHTHATLLLTLGQHPKIVSERLGHSSISITLDTYSHVMPNMQADAAAKLAEAFKQNGL